MPDMVYPLSTMHANVPPSASVLEPRAMGAAAIGRDILLRRMRNLSSLNEREIELVRSLSDQVKVHDPGSMICPRADGSPYPRLIVSGWACRPRLLSDGRRQMLAVHLPLDVLGDRGDRRPLAMTPAAALTPVRTISAAPLYDAMANKPDQFPGLIRAFTKIERMEENQLLDHVVRLGCQTALQRIASCLLELHRRMEAIGFTHDGSYQMPLTQEALGELLGLSLVHVNRIVRQLKSEGLFEFSSGIVRVMDFQRVSLLADRPVPFDDAKYG